MSDRKDEYQARINRVMDYVEAHLDEPMTLGGLADVACFSRYHFHRIFGAMVGETLSHFVQRLRLERAAGQLVYNQQKPITDIALDCGFSSSSTFARAFKAHFGKSASEWRKGESERQSKLGTANGKESKTLRKRGEALSCSSPYFDPSSKTMRWRVEMKGTNAVDAEVVIQEMPELHVAYVRHVGPYAGDEQLFEKLWGQLMSWAGPRGLVKPPETTMLSVYHDDPEVTDEDKLRVSVCITVPESTKAEGAIGTMTIAAGTYGVASFEIDPAQYSDAWTAVYGGWLPGSGYQPDDRPALEVCRNDPKQHPEGKHLVNICVPVKPI